MADLIADNPVTAVLNNADLLGFICKDLWDIEQALGSLVDGIRIHSLYSLALTCHTISETALDCLWHEICGMKPLLYIFPRGLSPDNNQWILPDIISDDTWVRFERYSRRVRSITLDAQLRTVHSSTIFLRLAGRQDPLFPNLQKLRVDLSFAADPSILLFLASPRLDDVNFVFPSNAEAAMASTSVSTVGWKLPMLHSLTISCVQHGGHRPRPLGTICPFTNFSGLRRLRRLKIDSHSADVSFLVQLSSFPDLAHLQIVVFQSPLTHSQQTHDGFRSLVSLHITAHVSSMPHILRLIHLGSLTSLTYIDDYSQSYNQIREFMQDFHTEIVSRFPSLQTLSLNYRKYRGQLDQQYWESTRAVFEPLCGLCKLQEFTYNAMLALETNTVERLLAPAWPEIRVFNIPLVQGPCPTYEVLCTLAKCYPHLSELSMPFAFPSDDSPLRNDHGPFSHKLRFFASPNTSVSRFAGVARYLDGMFPFLVSISGGQGWDQVESIVLETCQPVRRDQEMRRKPAEHLPHVRGDTALAELLEKEGRLGEAAELHYSKGRKEEAIELFLREAEKKSALCRAQECILEELWRRISFGVDSHAIRSDPALSRLVRFALRLDTTFIERTKAAELFMFTSIFQDQASRLRELALEFHKMGHSSAALLCLDQYFAQTFRIQDMVLVDAVEELNLFYIYANLLCTAAYRTDPCEDTGTATLFGFQRITENRFLVPRDTWLHTTALEVEHLQLGSRTSDSDSDFTLSASKLRNIFQHVLGLRLKQRIIAENDECARSKAFQPCLVFAVSGVCRQPICPEAHVSPSVVNTEYYNMRVRLHLQQILILQSFKENSHQEVEGKGTKFWLNRLYEALYPPYHAFGSISDLALSTIPEAVKALSIVKDWVRTLVYKREFSPATNFLTDVMRTTTLALTFDRSQAIYLRNAAYFRAPTPHMYIRRSGSSILPELLGVMSGSYTWSLSAGFAFVEHVVIQQLPINIGVLCDLVDFLCSSVILCRRQPGMAFLHDVTIPRSWLLRFIKYDLPYLNAEMQTETFHLLLTRMGDLLETLHDGGKGSEYLLYGIVRNLSNVPAVVRHVFVARILKAIGLLGYNVRSDLLRRKIRMLVLSMRHEGCTLPSLYSGYVDAARNSWDELAKAIRRSLQHDTMDEMIHLLHKSKVQATQRSASIGVRQVVYNNLADVQELLNPAHNQFESQSSLDEEADREEDSVDEMGNVTPIQNITAAEREIAASLIQRVYRKVLRHRQGVAKGGTTGLRAQVYASCTEEVSRLGDNPGIYLRLFLGPLPHILVCLEIVRVDTISHKMKAKGRLKTCSSDEYNTLDDLLTQANKANKAVVNLQKQLSPSSAFHKRRNIKQLRKLVEEANVLVSSLPFDTSSDLSDDLYLGIKGIVTERSSTSQICTE